MKHKQIDSDGQELYYLEASPGVKHYYNLKGDLHRIGGPAIEGLYCDQFYQNGLLTNYEGPAITEYNQDANRTIKKLGYFIGGIQYTKEDFDNKMLKAKLRRCLYNERCD